MKIGIVDDHALFREGMRYVLGGLKEEVQVFEAANAPDARSMLAAHPDLAVLLLDLDLPGEDGFSLMRWVSGERPDLPVVIMSASEDRGDMQSLIEQGARGYIPKHSSGSLAVNALRLVLDGSTYVPPSMLVEVPASNLRLTPRQEQVLALLAEGCSNKQIADRLVLAEPTVKMHVTAIIRALGVNNRTQAVRKALEQGLTRLR
jgi:DNA-binding NarL/FixJ family response regulator